MPFLHVKMLQINQVICGKISAGTVLQVGKIMGMKSYYVIVY